jgi:hypothetical protein
MSTKATIFLTTDNEHCYEDCSEKVKGRNGTVNDAIYIEFDKANMEVIVDDKTDLIIRLTDPDSPIYKLIKSLQE